MSDNRNQTDLKKFIIKLVAVTFAIIVVINVTYNLIFADKLENINKLLRNNRNNDIFKLLIKNFDSNTISTQNEISKKVKKSASTISVSLKDLQRNNIIERVIMNKSSKISSDIGFKILNGKQSMNYLVKYNL